MLTSDQLFCACFFDCAAADKAGSGALVLHVVDDEFVVDVQARGTIDAESKVVQAALGCCEDAFSIDVPDVCKVLTVETGEENV